MKYEIKLRFRMIFMLFAIVGGVVSILVGLLQINSIGDFSRGYFFGIGTGLIVGGTILAIKTARILKNENKFRIKKIEEEDERNNFLNLSSSHIAFLVTIVLLFIGTIYYAFKNEDTVNILSDIIMIMIAVKFICFLITKKCV